jgi:predicted MFS family arabinose efflux permease
MPTSRMPLAIPPTAAVLAGAMGQFLGYAWIFYLVSGFAVASAIVVTMVNPQEIDHHRARGGEDPAHHSAPIPVRELLQKRDLVVFLAPVVLFHFGNAAMLPMAGQMLAKTIRGRTPSRCRPASSRHSS